VRFARLADKLLGVIVNGGDAFFMRTMAAAIEISPGLDPVTDDLAAAMLALGGEGTNGAFEAIEIMGDAVDDYFQ